MFKPLPLFVGLRYTRAKRRNHFISFISLISIAGIALGVCALITVISVMNGFETELRERILGMASHAQVTELSGTLTNWPEVQEKIAEYPDEVQGSAPYIEFEGMINRNTLVSGALITGVLPDQEASVSDLEGMMTAGSLNDLTPGDYNIVLGKDLAFSMGAGVGDKVSVITPQISVTVAGVTPRLKRFTVAGVFDSGMQQYDSIMAYIHLKDAATLFKLGDNVSGLRLKLDDLYRAPEVSASLGKKLGFQYWITDWTQVHQSFFAALSTERRIMFIILSLIIVVAAFNIVSTLVMLVTDKRADIAILRTLGFAPSQVMWVFIIQGALIGLVGTILGVVGGVLLASNVGVIVPAVEKFFNKEFLDPSIYPLSTLPSDVRFSDVSTIGIVAFLITILATLYPAWSASRTKPVEALRYE